LFKLFPANCADVPLRNYSLMQQVRERSAQWRARDQFCGSLLSLTNHQC